MKQRWLTYAVSISSLVFLGSPLASAQNVTLTPLGSNQGEFCASDRAILFEDPGPGHVRILIAPGTTVNGATDSRLNGDVDVILLDHAHVDHIGNRAGDNVCAGGGGTPLTGIPNVANIAAGKNSAMFVGGELVPWLQDRIKAALGGSTVGGCGGYGPTSGVGNLTEVRRTSPCVDTLRPGGKRELTVAGVSTGVTIAVVQATHSNGIPAAFTSNSSLFPAGLTGYGGTETGYIILFSNGLSVYWTGDSGFIGDMNLFSKFYDVNLAIVHMGDVFTMGPEEGAFAVNELIRPKTAIPEHANEVATNGGKVLSGTRTERFLSLLKGGVKGVVPLSGKQISCDGKGRCTQSH